MVCAGGNPHPEVRRDEPDSLAGGHLHNAPDRVDELIRTVGVFHYIEPTRVLVRERRNQNAARGIVFRNKAVSHGRYIMAQYHSCDKRSLPSSLRYGEKVPALRSKHHWIRCHFRPRPGQELLWRNAGPATRVGPNAVRAGL